MIMKKHLFVLFAALVALSLSAQNFRNVNLAGTSLESILGDDVLQIDSITITGKITKDDYKTLAKAVIKGHLTGIDLSGCVSQGDSVFWLTYEGRVSVKLRYFRFPQGVKMMSNSLKGAVLHDFSIPSSIRTIGLRSFQGATIVDDLNIAEGVDSIGYDAFGGTKMPRNVYLPASLRAWSACSFYQTKATATETNLWFRGMTPPAPDEGEEPGSAFVLEKNIWTIHVPKGAKQAYEKSSDFVGMNIVEYDPETTFTGKTTHRINLSDGAPHMYDAIGADNAVSIDSIVVVGGELTPDDYYFLAGCSQNGRLTGVDLSRATSQNDEIPDWAFRPRIINGAPGRVEANEDLLGYLHYIRLPRNTYRVGEQAFFKTCLKEIEIPKTVRVIGEQAFSNCDDLTEVTVRNADASTIDARYAFGENMSTVTLTVPTGSGGSFASNVAWAGFGRIKEKAGLYTTRYAELSGISLAETLGDDLYAADSLVVTGALKVSDFKSLRSGIYNGVLSGVNLSGCTIENNAIPEMAFSVNEDEDLDQLSGNLLYVTLPNGTTSVGKNAFLNCDGLQGVQLSSSVRFVAEGAFSGCKRARGFVAIPEGVSRLSTTAFEGCRHLAGFGLPSTVSVLEPSCFMFNNDGDAAWNVTFKVNRMLPPTASTSAGETAFGYAPADLKGKLQESVLYVLLGAKQAYASDEVWGCFGNIIETSELDGGTNGVSAITVENEAIGNARVYTIDGRTVAGGINTMPSGIYIVNGKKIVK